MCKLKLAIILLVIISACTKTSKQPSEIEIIKIDTNQKSVPFITDIFKIVRSVPLQTSKECLVKNISSIKIMNNRIYTFSNKKVFEWSEQGKFVKTIGEIGQGPEAMLNPTDFALSPNGKIIAIWDNMRESIFNFTSNGDLLDSKRIGPRQVINFCWTKSNKLILYSNYATANSKECSFFLANPDGRDTKQLLPLNPDELGDSYMGYHNFPTFGTKQYLWKHLDNIIYELGGDDELSPRYRIEFDENNIEVDKLIKFQYDCYGLANEIKKNKFCQMWSFNENSYYYAVSYSKGEKLLTNIISKNGHQQQQIQHEPMRLDPIGEFFFPHFYEDYMLLVVEPYKLKTNLKQMLPLAKKQMGESLPILEKIASDSSEGDNPIILFLEYKNI